MTDNTKAELAKRDTEHLLLQPQFLRWAFTMLQRSGMFDHAYGSDAHSLAMLEGRRSLGFDMLKDAERVRPDALLAILQAELHALTENPNGDPIRTDDSDDREPDDRNAGRGRRSRTAAEPDAAAILDYRDERAENG